MHHRRITACITTAAILLCAAASHAARPQSWNFATQKDFFEGRFENVVVDSYGQLTLGRTLTPIPAEHAGESVQGFAQTPDGSLYVATSPSAKVFRIKDGKTEVVYTAPKGFEDITAITCDSKGDLLVALGESAKLISIHPAGDTAVPTTRFENKDVDYIWSIVPSTDGAIYLGTGPHGKVYKLAGEAEPEVLLETGQKNVTALVLDKSNNLIAGTDAHGLVIRVDAATKKPFVLLDAGKLDVNALLTDADGNVYVATAKAQFNDQNGKEAGGGSGDSMDEPETRSKPDVPEKEPVEPTPAGADDAGKVPATQGMGPIAPGFQTVLGAAGSDIPADLKAMLKKANAANKPSAMAHSSKSKSGTLPTHSSQLRGKSMNSDETASADDVSGVTRISPEGLATPLVQDQGECYSLLLVGDELLIGTGDEGKLYSYHPRDESLSLIARVKEQQISNLFADRAGNIFLGTANMAQIYELGATLAHSGSFTSQVLDASHTASWGHAMIDAATPGGSKTLIESRSGNTQDVQASAKFWSDWTATGENSKITSPAARFFQFRITLSADDKTPTVSNLRLAYQTQNLAPKIKNLSLDLPGQTPDGSADPDSMPSPDDTPPGEKLSHISWEATDPNGDTLLFRLYYKQITPEGKDVWTPLARDLKDAVYEWDTRAIPDGKYQVKVVASDSPDNPSPAALESARASAAFIINHTPPALSDLVPSVDGNKATVTGMARDVLSPVADVRYQVDGNFSGGTVGDWQPAAASDKIFDSPQEAFTLVTRPLSAGPHRITIRATDAAGNSSYKAVTVIVKP